MVSQNPARFGSQWRCGSEDMFLVAEEKDSRCSCLYPSLMFISKGQQLKAYSISN